MPQVRGNIPDCCYSSMRMRDALARAREMLPLPYAARRQFRFDGKDNTGHNHSRQRAILKLGIKL